MEKTNQFEVGQLGSPQVSTHGGARPQRKGFAASTAAVTGQSKRTTNRALARAKALGDTTLEKITGTSLDTGVEMDALAKLPEVERQEIIERAVAGEKVSAKEIIGDEFYRVSVKAKSLIELRDILAGKLAAIDSLIAKGC